MWLAIVILSTLLLCKRHERPKRKKKKKKRARNENPGERNMSLFPLISLLCIKKHEPLFQLPTASYGVYFLSFYYLISFQKEGLRDAQYFHLNLDR